MLTGLQEHRISSKEIFNAEKAMKVIMISDVKTKELTWFFHKDFSENLR